VPIIPLIDNTENAGPASEELYTNLNFPEREDRPYTVINMVATVDGKTLIGPEGSTAHGLGGPTDQLLMRRIQGCVDAAIIGASTLRAGHVVYRPEMWRAVVTRTGDIPFDNRFFTDAPDRAIVFAPHSLPESDRKQLSAIARLELCGPTSVNVIEAARRMRLNYSVRSMALEGGSTLNYDFISQGLADELFLTVAPKLKGGAHLPSIVGGEGFPDHEYKDMSLVSLYRDGDELYFRYRIGDIGRVKS